MSNLNRAYSDDIMERLNRESGFYFPQRGSHSAQSGAGLSGKGEGFVMYSTDDVYRMAEERVLELQALMSLQEQNAIRVIAKSQLTIEDIRLLVGHLIRS